MALNLDALVLEGPTLPPVAARPARPFTYPHIPFLQELLKRHGGLPGVTYFQVTLDHIKQVQDKGFKPIDGARSYTIQGPQGEIDCALYGWGEPIRGADPNSSLRRCLVDGKIEWSTGLVLRDGVLLELVHIERPPARPEPQRPTNGEK